MDSTGSYNAEIAISSYLIYAIFFVFITRKCFLEKKDIKKSIISLFISPSAAYTISFIASIYFIADLFSDSTIDAIIINATLSALIQIIIQILFMFIYIKLVKANNQSIAMFVYLCSLMIVPNLIFISFTSKSYIPVLMYLILHILFYHLVIVPLSAIQKNRLVTDKRLFIILPILAYIFNTIFFIMYVYQYDISLYRVADSGFSEAIKSFRSVDPAGAKALTNFLHSITDILLHQADLTIYPSIFVVTILIVAFAVITKNIKYMNVAISAQKRLKILSVEVMEALAHTIDAKDEYTKGHSTRVAKYSKMIAEKMKLSEEDCENIYYMGLLHDIGKIGVSNDIINKPSRLTDEEFDEIKKHPRTGYDILSEIKSRPDLAIGALRHHEKYDGSGYPDHLKGIDIPLEARIIAVADAYDAMTSNRSYRKYLEQNVVREEIEKNINVQFDEEAAKCMLMIIDEDTEYKLHE